MLVMVYVYLRISCVVANRHDDMLQIKVHQVRNVRSFINPFVYGFTLKIFMITLAEVLEN